MENINIILLFGSVYAVAKQDQYFDVCHHQDRKIYGKNVSINHVIFLV
jgi:hypothetical protein